VNPIVSRSAEINSPAMVTELFHAIVIKTLPKIFNSISIVSRQTEINSPSITLWYLKHFPISPQAPHYGNGN
jgi:hypothetical protein